MKTSFMVRPLPLLAVAVLVVNDHLLKQCFPGVITGKLSDFAGLFFFPLFLVDAMGLVRKTSRVTLVGACIATAVVFALVKTTALGHSVYCIGLGALQAPIRGSFHRVRMTMDATDLVALVSCLAAYVYAAPRYRPSVSTTLRIAAAARRMIPTI
jgi:hypothetical protein